MDLDVTTRLRCRISSDIDVRLRCRISSDIDVLDGLHVLYPWIPNSQMIRPLNRAKKEEEIAEIARTWVSFTDFIKHFVFQIPAFRSFDGWCVGSAEPREKVVLEKANFPYNVPVGTLHYVLWFYDRTPEENEVTDILNQLLVDGEQFVWYINPKMTIPEIFHVQVFVVERHRDT
jgi:hypothetical protein